MVTTPYYQGERATLYLGDCRTIVSVDWPEILGKITRHVLRGKRHVYVFGYPEDALRGPLHLGAACDMAWDKEMLGAGDLASPWGPAHEPITFGVYRDRPSDRAAGRGGLTARLRKGTVLRIPRVNGSAVRHPDEKPIELLLPLVESSSCRGDLVLDPTCGVGSTVAAAVLTGRRGIGIELNERYLDIAVDRVREAERIAKLAEAV